MTTNELQGIIRRASPEDADIIAALTNAAYAKFIPRIGRKPQPMTADYRQMVAEHAAWLLCLGNQPVGVLVLMLEPDDALIYSVAVDPRHQKRGLGRRLLAWAEQQARQEGHQRIRLYTNEHMVENIALYSRLGYLETRREPHQGSMLVHMAKRLIE